jgi:hypothetical protein
MLVFRRILMVSMLWALLSGGAVIVCSTGDSSLRNRPPVAQDDDYSVPAGTALVGSVRAVDPDGDPLVYRIVSGPTLGRLESFNGSTGAFRYASDSPGADSFEFKASDGRRDSNTGRIRIDVTAGFQALAIAPTAAGPVGLWGGELFLLGPSGPVPLEDGVTGIVPAAGGWRIDRASGAGGCLDPWSGIGAAGRCGEPLGAAAGQPDPFTPGRSLRVTAAGHRVRIAERLGGPDWTGVVELPGPADAAALHFDVSTPGRVWLAVVSAGGTRIALSDDSGRGWRQVASMPGRAASMAALGAGRAGVLVLRAGPESPVLVHPRPDEGMAAR